MTYVPPFGIGLLQVQAAPKTTLWFNSLLKGMTEFSKAIMVLVMVFAANGYRSIRTGFPQSCAVVWEGRSRPSTGHEAHCRRDRWHVWKAKVNLILSSGII